MQPLRTPVVILAIWLGAGWLTGAGASTTQGSGTARQYQFESRIEDGPGDLHGSTVGRITVLREGDRRAVYVEDTPLQPGCGSIPAVTLISGHLAVLCGNLGGRHNTYKVFRHSGAALDVTTLDIGDGNSVLETGNNGQLLGLVMRRDLFPQITGPRYFPVVYGLHDDAITFGFRPVFSAAAAPLYLRYYQSLKQESESSHGVEEMLAMLLAMQDSALTCKELAYLEKRLVKGGKFQQHKAARTFLMEWAQKLPAIGYPVFNNVTCKGTQ